MMLVFGWIRRDLENALDGELEARPAAGIRLVAKRGGTWTIYKGARALCGGLAPESRYGSRQVLAQAMAETTWHCLQVEREMAHKRPSGTR